MTKINRIHAREVLDSRGNPTVEVEVALDDGRLGSAIVPSGASTGTAEAIELRDDDDARYDGRGVLQAVENVNRVLAPELIGRDPMDQMSIDQQLLDLDGSPQKSNLGGNALLGVSLAVAHAGAAARGIPLYRHFADLFNTAGIPVDRNKVEPKLPLPMTNMISGGLHAGGNLDMQDVLIEPIGAPSYSIGLEWIVRVYRRLGELLTGANYEGRLVGDEGGYGPKLKSNEEAIEFVARAIEAAKLRPGRDVVIALDVAATHFFDGTHYRLASQNNERLTNHELVEVLAAWVEKYPIVSIEDGLAEEDWDGWRHLTKRLGERVDLVGDDLFATNVERVTRGIELGAANAVLIKVNQIGTLSETFTTMHAAFRAGFKCVVSARSGETEDSTIADLAVGTGAGIIKIGSIVRSERLSKYNRLLRIEEELGSDARAW